MDCNAGKTMHNQRVRGVFVALIFTLVFALTGCGSATQPEAPAPIQKAAQGVIHAGAPGLVLFARHGDDAYTIATGFSDAKTKTPMRPTDTFRIGSLTKSFVSDVVLSLTAEGKLSLGDSVSKYLPDLVPGRNKISIRQLLNHTSGLFSYTDDPTFRQPYTEGDLGHRWTPRQIVRLAVAHPPLFSPGKGYSYSNTNYVLLGLIIERVTNSTVAQELLDRVIWPLELSNTRLPADSEAPTAHGYLKRTVNGRTIDVTQLTSAWGWSAGAIIATGDEAGKFYSELLRGRLIAPGLVDQMKTTSKGSDYGLGLERFATGCGATWGHDGNFPGYVVFARTSPDAKRQVILLVNSDWSALPARMPKLVEHLIRLAYCTPAP